MRVVLDLNGRRRQLDLPSGTTLLEAIRDYAGLTGTKYGCGEGECGACTVLVDGRAMRSCITAAAGVAGRKIVTIEGLARGATLHPVQQAFLEHSAFQCGYCAPGMILGAVALLAKNPHPAAGEVREGLDGHICRCGAYVRIVEAVQAAAAKVAEKTR
jgi:nicotinate dehydrogenase subunit A